MKKNYIFLAFLMFLSLSGCTQIKKYHYSGDFKYYVTYIGYDGNETKNKKDYKDAYATIIKLSSQAKKKKYIIVPETIDGFKVKRITFDKEKWESDSLKKVFIPFKARVDNKKFDYNFIVIMLADENDQDIYTYDDVYVTSYYKNNKFQYFAPFTNNCYANLSYMYNYDTDINYGYYWIDRVNYGKLINYIPEDPVRDGYTFGGWYKEKECLNKWDFDIDVIPQLTEEERFNRIEPETFLYAKWIKE